MLRKIYFSFGLCFVFGWLAQSAYAFEDGGDATPRITVGGRTIVTADSHSYTKKFSTNKKDDINTDDSVLLLRFDKKMYGLDNGVAGTVVGFREVGNTIIFHQLNVFYWNDNFLFTIGKSKLRNTIIEFPTLRDEDLIDYTHVNNVSSDSQFDQEFGSIAALDWYLGSVNQSIGIWSGNRNNDANNPNAVAAYDTRGVKYEYTPSRDLLYLNRIRRVGLIVDSQRVATATGDKLMQALILGFEFNLNINPISNWSMGIQAISNAGIEEASDLTSVSSRAQIKSNSQVISLRYTHRPRLVTRWQLGLTIATKKYENIVNVKNTTVVGNINYRLGQGVNLISQIKRTDNSNDINNGNDETEVQFGISYQFDTMYNNTIGKRNTILDLEHGYLR